MSEKEVFDMTVIKKWKDPMSALTHLIAFLLAIPCAIFLILKAVNTSAYHIVGMSVFGASIILLYLASTIYHMVNAGEKYSTLLRRIDHMMIFVLIAGSYTPICLVPLRGVWGWTLLTIIWAMAILGIILKAVWITAPRWLSTSIYVIMGWLVVIAFYPLCKNVEILGIVLLTLGGIIYTIGALIYGLKIPIFNFGPFGFHEIFHLFVIGGSICHIIFMFMYIL